MIVRRHSLEKENANAGENMTSNYFFMETVKCLGDSWDVFQVLFIDVEEYIWTIYNAKIKFLTMQEKNTFTKKDSCLSVTRTPYKPLTRHSMKHTLSPVASDQNVYKFTIDHLNSRCLWQLLFFILIIALPPFRARVT